MRLLVSLSLNFHERSAEETGVVPAGDRWTAGIESFLARSEWPVRRRHVGREPAQHDAFGTCGFEEGRRLSGPEDRSSVAPHLGFWLSLSLLAMSQQELHSVGV